MLFIRDKMEVNIQDDLTPASLYFFYSHISIDFIVLLFYVTQYFK